MENYNTNTTNKVSDSNGENDEKPDLGGIPLMAKEDRISEINIQKTVFQMKQIMKSIEMCLILTVIDIQ